MQKNIDLFSTLIGRICIGGFFLSNGIQEILNLPATMQIFIQAHYAAPLALALIAASIEIVGGMAVLVGFQTKLAATILVLYILLTSVLLLHSTNPLRLQIFLQSFAIVGGLLYVAAYGAGRWSTDRSSR